MAFSRAGFCDELGRFARIVIRSLVTQSLRPKGHAASIGLACRLPQLFLHYLLQQSFVSAIPRVGLHKK